MVILLYRFWNIMMILNYYQCVANLWFKTNSLFFLQGRSHLLFQLLDQTKILLEARAPKYFWSCNTKELNCGLLFSCSSTYFCLVIEVEWKIQYYSKDKIYYRCYQIPFLPSARDLGVKIGKIGLGFGF